MQLSDLLLAARVSVANPRLGFQMMRSLRLDSSTLVMALAAITVIGVIPAELMVWIMQQRGEVAIMDLGGGPFGLAMLQLGAGILSALAIYHVGRMFGGHGAFVDALLVVVWMQSILTLIQVAQLVTLLIFPPFAQLLGLMAMVLVFWLSSGFIAEAHGFRSQLKTLFGMFASGLLIVFALAFLLVLLGFAPEMPNV